MSVPISMLIYGPSGIGKSRLANTAPAPRLILDVEGGSRFLPGHKIRWKPLEEKPPEADGTWETCTVILQDWQTAQTVMQWLRSGQHGFRSVVIDSLTELQKRCADAISSATEQFDQRTWGVLLRDVELFVRQFRDLNEHPVMPVECTVITALEVQRDGRFTPAVQGALVRSLPAFLDIVGYLYVEPTPDGHQQRKLLVVSNGVHVAKDRTDVLATQHQGVVPSPNIAVMASLISNTIDGEPHE